MKLSRQVQYAYVAGFVDGEGCIRINRRNPREGKSTNYSLLVNVSQKDGRPMDLLYGLFGGCVVLKRKTDGGFKTDRENWIYEWRLTDRKAGEMLKQILPFLVYKKPQAELALRFQERLNNRPKTIGGRYQPLDQHENEIRSKMYDDMCALKRQYVKSKNPSVKAYDCPSMMQV